MSSIPRSRFTPEQYLERERRAEFKSEYFHGEIFAMAGARAAHNLIVANLVGELRARLRDRGCRTFPSDMKVEVGPDGLFTYPDVSVVCGEPRYHDDQGDMILNPVLIAEVLSPSTEAYDRGEKFAQYQQLDSLKDYLLVSPSKHRVEHFVRQPDNQWLLSVVTSLDETVVIASLDCELPMAEIYYLVELEPPPPIRAV